MKRPFDSLFSRVLLAQTVLALVVALLFGVLALRQQAQTAARATAPLWAAALAPVIEGGIAAPRDETVSTVVELLPGPPPPDARELPFYPRYRALTEELRALGVPLAGLRVSGRTGDAITWLALRRAGETELRWVGVAGEFEGIDVQGRSVVGVVLALIAIFALAAWINRRVVRPLAELSEAMRRFAADGSLPPPPAARASAELRELAQQFAGFARQRKAIEEERRLMLAAISHDLRSPLGRIRLAAELLPEEAPVGARRESIIRNVQAADRLLGSFIDLARTENEPFDQRVDLAALVREQLADEPDVVLAPLPAAPLWLERTSALALERALRNLLDNARRHGRPPIEVTVRREGGEALLTVRDHGPGIAAEERAALLEPFQRGEKSRGVPGTGLGLAIVLSTAARSGGTLTLGDAAPGLRAELRLALAP